MKKAIALISFVCYFILTTGFVVNRHYCMERLASVHFFETETEFCGLCGMETHKSNGCCRDELTVVKLELIPSTTEAISFSLPTAEALHIIPASFITTPVFNTENKRHFHNHSPPLLSAQEIYLRNNVFRI